MGGITILAFTFGTVAPLPHAHTYMRVEQSKPTCNGRRLALEGSIFAPTSSFYIGCEW